MVEDDSQRVEDVSLAHSMANLDSLIIAIDRGTFKTELSQAYVEKAIGDNYSCLPDGSGKRECLAAFRERGYLK